MHRHLPVILACALACPLGCIHVKESETAAVDVADGEAGLNTLKVKGGLAVRHLIYKPSEWPLERFFDRLTSGELVDAFKRIDLRYKPATSDNEALQRLLDEGLVPVYVKVTNRGKAPVTLAEGNLLLAGTPAIAAGDLPRKLEELNLAAVGANIYNTSVVVLGFAALMATIILASRGHTAGGGLQLPTEERSEKVYNATTKTTAIDYRDYLFSETTLAPGQTAAGLVFFQLEAPDWDGLKLKAKI